MTRERYLELLQQLDDQVLSLGDLVASTISKSVRALECYDVAEAQRLIEADNQIDARRYEIENQALLLIATQQPLAGDLRTIAAILTIVTELERIGDYCEGIARLTLRMAAESVTGQLEDIQTMADITEELLRQALVAFRDRDVEAAGTVWQQDDEVDALYAQVFRKMVLNMTTDKTSVKLGTYLLWVAHNIERIADRVTNISERIAFVVNGDIGAFRERLRAETMPA